MTSLRRRVEPTAASMTGTGALPGRNPGIFMSSESLREVAALPAVIWSSVRWKVTSRSKGPVSVTLIVIGSFLSQVTVGDTKH